MATILSRKLSLSGRADERGDGGCCGDGCRRGEAAAARGEAARIVDFLKKIACSISLSTGSPLRPLSLPAGGGRSNQFDLFVPVTVLFEPNQSYPNLKKQIRPNRKAAGTIPTIESSLIFLLQTLKATT